MKFNLRITSVNKAARTDEKREQLEAFGFRFDEDGDVKNEYDEGYIKPSVEINTFEELIAFATQWGKVIVNPEERTPESNFESTAPTIEIYNDWRE